MNPNSGLTREDVRHIRAIVLALAFAVLMAAAVAGNRPYPGWVRTVFWVLLMASVVVAWMQAVRLGGDK